MDVPKALSELYAEKKRLDIAISALERRASVDAKSGGDVRSRRGRRSMSAEEREEVSRRMSSYWASRRASTARSEPASGSEHPVSGPGVPGSPGVSATQVLEPV